MMSARTDTAKEIMAAFDEHRNDEAALDAAMLDIAVRVSPKVWDAALDLAAAEMDEQHAKAAPLVLHFDGA